ncbi:MAG: ubiquinol-cytochrome reductase [Phycisphaerales bacterium]|nr:ubiquinol-cytochrome reductase [Phycisphaerales bacterium]
MAFWLAKTEPDTYSYDDLVREKKCTWDGVANPGALKHIRSIAKGDSVFVYHTGKEKAVIGIAEATTAGYGDPAVMDLKPSKKLKRPVTLKEIKADKAFEAWELVKQARLSVMPVPKALWDRIEKLAATDAGDSR